MNYIKILHQCRFLFWFNNHRALVTIVIYPKDVLKWLIVTNHIKLQSFAIPLPLFLLYLFFLLFLLLFPPLAIIYITTTQ